MIDLNIESNIIEYYNTKSFIIKYINDNWKNYLLQRYNDCNDIKESYLRIKYNIEEHPKCCICGKPCKYQGMKNYIYSETCGSKKCKSKLMHNKSIEKTYEQKQIIKEKIKKTCLEKYGDECYRNTEKYKQTCLEKYGVDNVAKLNVIKEKYKQTCLEKYGVETFVQSQNFKDKVKQNSLEKYGVDHPSKSEIKIQHTIETYLNKYGVTSSWNIPGVKEKSMQTKLEKYGNKYYSNNEKAIQTKLEKYGNLNNIDKIKETKLEKYGNPFYLNSEQMLQTKQNKYGDKNYNNKEKTKETCMIKYGGVAPACSEDIKEKMKSTCIEKYGKSSYTQTDEYKILMTDPYIIKKRNDKIYETMKKNKTFNSSKTELESYDLLKQKYPDVIHHYKDNDRYPFNCDFYIPSLDLFIECQYGQFHHGRPYLETEKDLKDIETLKQNAKRKHKETGKEKSRYDVELETWTIRDVKKRNIAKENNLNYIEFWNINELKWWLNN